MTAMVAFFSRVTASSARTSSLENISLLRALRSLSQSHRVFVARNYLRDGITNRHVRGVATKRPGRPKGGVRTRSTTEKSATGLRKKATAQKTTAKNTTVKKTATKRKKKPAKKTVVKKKKVLTAEEKAAKKEKTAREALLKDIKSLKAQTLEPPKKKPTKPITILVARQTGRGQDLIKSASQQYQNLSESEKEELKQTAKHYAQENQVAYRTWLASKTPEEIRLANNARAALRRRVAKAYPERKVTARNKAWSLLQDDRQIKGPLPSYVLFTIERRAAVGSGGSPTMFVKQVAKEWNELSQSEKKKYTDLAEADKERYSREYQSTYGHAPRSL